MSWLPGLLISASTAPGVPDIGANTMVREWAGAGNGLRGQNDRGNQGERSTTRTPRPR